MATTNPPGQVDMGEGGDLWLDESQVPGYGWLFFAGSVLGLAGLMRILDSVWAFRYKGDLPDRLQGGVLGDNLTTYAWLWLLVGVVLILSSFLILTRSQLARWVGFAAATIGGVSAVTWMPYYPVWSFTYIAIALLTFYALARYGSPNTARR
jgi:hypothetical protein